MYIESYSPIDNKLIGKVKISTAEEIAEKVNNSKKAQQLWYDVGIEKRLEYLNKIYEQFSKDKEELARIITTEMGIPIILSRDDIALGLDYMKWDIKNCKYILEEAITYEDEKQEHKVIYEPKGVAATIIVWSFPFSSFIWQTIQNLIVGNTVVIKHSQYTPVISKKIEEIVNAILPKDVFNTVYGDSTVEELLINQDIDVICYTGNSIAGEKIYRVASKKFIPVLLELGGSAPGIVLEDADIDDIIGTIFHSRFYNAGQAGDGLKRLIVHESIMKEVIDKLKKVIENVEVGNPFDEAVDIGPLISEEQLCILEEQVNDDRAKGAEIICGGNRIELNNGNYYQPTIITNISKKMRVYNEEVLGPVLPIISFKTIEEAIEIANDTQYGLGGYIYTKDMNKFNVIARKLKTGMVALNNLTYIIPCNPFVGYKRSGLGINNAEFGFKELCNIKVITFEK